MFRVSKWIPISWFIITLLPIHSVYANSSWQADENVEVYKMFHENELPEQLIEDFHIELSVAPLIDAHIYMTDQKEPFNNPIRMEVILSCGGRAFIVNRDHQNRSLKTFCDFSAPRLIQKMEGRLAKQKELQILLFQFDENEGQCPSHPNAQETFPLESIIKLCRTLE